MMLNSALGFIKSCSQIIVVLFLVFLLKLHRQNNLVIIFGLQWIELPIPLGFMHVGKYTVCKCIFAPVISL